MNASVRKLILDLAVEDAIGLWEIAWRSRESHPGPTRDELVGVTLEMVREGLVEVVSSSDERHALSDADAAAEVRDDVNWAEPQSGADHVRIVATAKGERAYYSR